MRRLARMTWLVAATLACRASQQPRAAPVSRAAAAQTPRRLVAAPDGGNPGAELCAPSLIAYASPGRPVDFIELRIRTEGAPIETFGARGAPCGGARAPAACASTLAAVTVPLPPGRPPPGVPHSVTYLVFSRGDEVGAVAAADVGGFLAPIADPFEAAFVVRTVLGNFGLPCNQVTVRAAPDGFRVRTWQGDGCGTDHAEVAVLVRRDGQLAHERVRVLDPAQPSCEY